MNAGITFPCSRIGAQPKPLPLLRVCENGLAGNAGIHLSGIHIMSYDSPRKQGVKNGIGPDRTRRSGCNSTTSDRGTVSFSIPCEYTSAIARPKHLTFAANLRHIAACLFSIYEFRKNHSDLRAGGSRCAHRLGSACCCSAFRSPRFAGASAINKPPFLAPTRPIDFRWKRGRLEIEETCNPPKH